MKTKEEVLFTVKDTGFLLQLFQAATLTGAEFKQAMGTMEKIETLHKALVETGMRVKGEVS